MDDREKRSPFATRFDGYHHVLEKLVGQSVDAVELQNYILRECVLNTFNVVLRLGFGQLVHRRGSV